MMGGGGGGAYVRATPTYHCGSDPALAVPQSLQDELAYSGFCLKFNRTKKIIKKIAQLNLFSYIPPPSPGHTCGPGTGSVNFSDSSHQCRSTYCLRSTDASCVSVRDRVVSCAAGPRGHRQLSEPKIKYKPGRPSAMKMSEDRPA